MLPTLNLQKYKILSGSALKLLAIISMAIDHSAAVLYPVVGVLRLPINVLGYTTTLYWIMRMIGRLAFPIFCFLIAEGYRYTGNKWKYGLRLLIFALISEVPFDLMVSGKLLHLTHQNVYFTLFMGFAMIFAYENLPGRLWKYAALAGISAVALCFHSDYSLYGVLLVFMFYVLRNAPVAQPLMAYPLLKGELYALLAIIPINLYNGKRGFIQSTWLKWLFYIFYPLHITLLVAILHLLK